MQCGFLNSTRTDQAEVGKVLLPQYSGLAFPGFADRSGSSSLGQGGRTWCAFIRTRKLLLPVGAQTLLVCRKGLSSLLITLVPS